MKALVFILIFFVTSQSFAYSWFDTEAGYFPQGFSCMTNEEKANFKYFLSHSYSGRPYDNNRSQLEGNPAVKAKDFFNENLGKEEWLCPAQALSIRSEYELEKEKTRYGDMRRTDIIHSVRFSKRWPGVNLIAGEWGVEILGGSYDKRIYNLNYENGILAGEMATSKITVRPLNLTPRHRFIIITMHNDQHVICYPKSLHKECNPFKPAPEDQLNGTNAPVILEWPTDNGQPASENSNY